MPRKSKEQLAAELAAHKAKKLEATLALVKLAQGLDQRLHFIAEVLTDLANTEAQLSSVHRMDILNANSQVLLARTELYSLLCKIPNS